MYPKEPRKTIELETRSEIRIPQTTGSVAIISQAVWLCNDVITSMIARTYVAWSTSSPKRGGEDWIFSQVNTL